MRFLRIKRNKDSNYYRSVLKSFFKRKKIKYTKKLLLWEMGGFDLILRQNAIIGSAMKLRGYKPIIVICDGTPQACIQREINNEEKMEDWCKRCKSCSLPMKNEAKKYDMEYIYTSQFIDKDKKKEFHDFSLKIPLKEITDFEYKVVNIGKITFSSFSRYMKGFVVDVSDITKEHEPIYRKYFYATLVNFYICDVILTKIKPDSILTSHGVYIDYTPQYI